MSVAHLSSRLEPTGLSRSDGKRPHGVTLVPWKGGRLLVWNATYPTHLPPPSVIREAGAVAAQTEQSKQEKCAALNQCHIFTPVAIETAGPFGPETSFLRDLGCRLKQVTGEAKSFSYLQQRLSVAVQRSDGNNGGTTFSIDFFPNCLSFFGGH